MLAAPRIILESDISAILEYWIYLFLGGKFFQIFQLSRLAELSARFVHLESSKSKIEQLNKELRLQYFRQRHELIDRNMRELFAARLAFK
jgi:F0F1-type ATP synthase gamma subunit